MENLEIKVAGSHVIEKELVPARKGLFAKILRALFNYVSVDRYYVTVKLSFAQNIQMIPVRSIGILEGNISVYVMSRTPHGLYCRVLQTLTEPRVEELEDYQGMMLVTSFPTNEEISLW
ncbi:MAG: hypothetical protein QM762_12855 [Chryseolinea sp.]